MALREEFARSGNWLFRKRSEFPLVVLAIVLVQLWLSPPPLRSPSFENAWLMLCLLVAAIGEAIRIYAVGHAPGGTSHRGTAKPAGKLVNTNGLYSIVRHPLYVGNLLMWLGPALYARSWQVLLITLLIFWVYYERVMYAEEEFLREKFGSEYASYAELTPAFIPHFRLWKSPALPFSGRIVIRREHSSIFAVFAVMTVLIYVRDFALFGHAQRHALWLGALGIAFILFLGAVMLTRRTELLNVPGR